MIPCRKDNNQMIKFCLSINTKQKSDYY